MGNRRHIFRNLLWGLLLLIGVRMHAQENALGRAQQLYSEKRYDDAALVIDSVVAHPQTSRDFVSWTTRGFIYYYIYVRTDKIKLESKLRDTVLISIRKSIALNPDSDYVNNNKKILSNLEAHYYKIAGILLQDSLNAERSLIAYHKYKDLVRLHDASSNADAKDVEYYQVVGSVFSEQFQKDNKNQKAQTTAKVALMKVLDVQPENPTANMNMGLLYFNQAVDLVKTMDGEIDITAIDELQDNVVKLAKQAEQFIYRVYKNDPKNRKACTALCYIYRMLYEIPKSDEFKKKAEDLGEKFDSTDPGKLNQTPPKDK